MNRLPEFNSRAENSFLSKHEEVLLVPKRSQQKAIQDLLALSNKEPVPRNSSLAADNKVEASLGVHDVGLGEKKILEVEANWQEWKRKKDEERKTKKPKRKKEKASVEENSTALDDEVKRTDAKAEQEWKKWLHQKDKEYKKKKKEEKLKQEKWEKEKEDSLQMLRDKANKMKQKELQRQRELPKVTKSNGGLSPKQRLKIAQKINASPYKLSIRRTYDQQELWKEDELMTLKKKSNKVELQKLDFGPRLIINDDLGVETAFRYTKKGKLRKLDKISSASAQMPPTSEIGKGFTSMHASHIDATNLNNVIPGEKEIESYAIPKVIQSATNDSLNSHRTISSSLRVLDPLVETTPPADRKIVSTAGLLGGADELILSNESTDSKRNEASDLGQEAFQKKNKKKKKKKKNNQSTCEGEKFDRKKAEEKNEDDAHLLLPPQIYEVNESKVTEEESFAANSIYHDEEGNLEQQPARKDNNNINHEDTYVDLIKPVTAESITSDGLHDSGSSPPDHGLYSLTHQENEEKSSACKEKISLIDVISHPKSKCDSEAMPLARESDQNLVDIAKKPFDATNISPRPNDDENEFYDEDDWED